MCTMQRRHFELIAKVIRELDLDGPNQLHVKRYVAMLFADALRGTNASFDRGRFVEACTRHPVTIDN